MQTEKSKDSTIERTSKIKQFNKNSKFLLNSPSATSHSNRQNKITQFQTDIKSAMNQHNATGQSQRFHFERNVEITPVMQVKRKATASDRATNKYMLIDDGSQDTTSDNAKIAAALPGEKLTHKQIAEKNKQVKANQKRKDTLEEGALTKKQSERMLFEAEADKRAKAILSTNLNLVNNQSNNKEICIYFNKIKEFDDCYGRNY